MLRLGELQGKKKIEQEKEGGKKKRTLSTKTSLSVRKISGKGGVPV